MKYEDMLGNKSLMDYLEIDDLLEDREAKKAEAKIAELGDYNLYKYNEDWNEE